MRMKIKDLPEELITMYNLTNKATADGFVYIKIQKGMYGLPQAGILAQELLEQCLNNMATVRAPSLQASGDTTIDLSSSLGNRSIAGSYRYRSWQL